MDKVLMKENSDPKATSKTKFTKQKSILLFIIIVILSLIITAAAYYFYFNNSRLREDTQQLKQEATNNQRQVAKLQAKQQQLMVEQQQLIMQLQKQGFSDEDWLLVDAIYWLRQAQWRLKLYADVTTTIAILQTVASHVAPVHSDRFDKLAAAIDADMKMLQALQLTNMDELQQQFGKLSQAIDALTLYQAHAIQQNEVRELNSSRWQKSLHSAWDALRQVVVVRHTDSDLTPLLQQQQLLNFKQYLQNLAQQAFWSALHHDGAAYHQRLQQMQHALQQHLLPNDKQLLLLQDQLAKLQKATFAATLPQQLTSFILAQQLQSESMSTMQGNTTK